MRERDKAWLALCMSAVLAVLGGCMADTRHLAFIPIGYEGWADTDTLTYTLNPLNGVEQGGELSLLLHTERYRYENIALGITIRQDTVLVRHEQRNYILGQHRAKKGVGHRSDYVLPVGNVVLCDTLPTTITLTHQLNQSILKGVRGIGVRIGTPLQPTSKPRWQSDWY